MRAVSTCHSREANLFMEPPSCLHSLSLPKLVRIKSYVKEQGHRVLREEEWLAREISFRFDWLLFENIFLGDLGRGEAK